MLDIFMYCLMVPGLVFMAYYALIAVWGSLRPDRKIPHAAPKKRIAVLAAARNESAVIAQLIESVLKQDYPKDLIDIYVIPNNCTDDTAKIARQAGASVLEPDIPVHSKGEAMSWIFDRLLDKHRDIDAFLILDADNVIAPNYFQIVNDALCAGCNLAQGFRDSKNYDDNWVTGCSSVFFWIMNRFFNRARFRLGMSCEFNGTGIVLSADYMRKVGGWHTYSLTEDLEFTAQSALHKEKIWWLSEAKAYDEQPLRFSDSYRQRRRWGAGTYQNMKLYSRRLFAMRTLQAFDMGFLFTGIPIQLISMVAGVYFSCKPLVQLLGTAAFWGALAGCLGGLALMGAAVCAGTALILHAEKKPVRKNLATVFGMIPFLISWIPANLVNLFTKPPKWVEIKHVRGVGIGNVQTSERNNQA